MDSDPNTLPVFVRPVHATRHSDFLEIAATTREIKHNRTVLLCSECLKPASDTGVSLRCCAKCKSARYCSKECQRQNWPIHKASCNADNTPDGIIKLTQKFTANKVLMMRLRLCFVFAFNLLHGPAAAAALEAPVALRVDAGIEPADITVFMQVLYGTQPDGPATAIEGMLQINAIRQRSSIHPVQAAAMQMWRNLRASVGAGNPVGLVEFVKEPQALWFPVHIQAETFALARYGAPFVHVSALTGEKIERPLSVDSSINYHIRSDAGNQLLLRTQMKEADVVRIRDVERGDARDAVQVLREKIDRELVYRRRRIAV